MSSETAQTHQVRVHIDQQAHHSPTSTTGAALYLLGNVSGGYELFREVSGNREDAPVPNDSTEIRLHEDEHFHSAPAHHHGVEIILDGKDVVSPQRRRNGRQIRELGPADRVDGFETQEVDANGKKKRTIRDDEEIELHRHERFRTVPSEGGPGC